MRERIGVTRDGGVLRIALTRPERHNAFDDRLVEELTEALGAEGADAGVRVIVLSGEGESFSAGADLEWMRRAAGRTPEENEAGALRMAAMFRAIADSAAPVVARVQGAAYGGGVGLVAACDIAVASSGARFALSEVRLGLVPAVISPFILAKVLPSEFRRYALTGERFDALEARRIGLVQVVAEAASLDEAVAEIVEALLAGGPKAQASLKELLRLLAACEPEAVQALTARHIARLRASAEGREGIDAFLERRAPRW